MGARSCDETEGEDILMAKIVPTYEDGVWNPEEESGGGGSLPAWMTTAGGFLAIAPTDDLLASLQTVTAPAGFRNNSAEGNFLTLIDEDGRETFTLDTYGDLIGRGSLGQGPSAILMRSADFPATFSIFSGDTDDSNGSRFLQTGGIANSQFSIYTNGSPAFMTAVAGADDHLASGECSLWFDKTNGAPKLMVKAKQQNGTVVTAAVALA